jgi:predicted ATPase
LLDDLQCCDRETLEWLHFLLRFDPQAQLLVVATARLEEMGADHPLESLLMALRGGAHVTELLLHALNADDTVSLAAYVAGRDLEPNEMADVYQETAGNPLFVIETIRMIMRGTGEVRRSSSSPGATNAASRSRLPPTVQAVIAARLEQLSPQARKVLSLAAIIGRAFTFPVLVQAGRDDEDTLVHGLDELWQRRIVREQGGDAYDFSHHTLREVAYAALSPVRRRLLHERVAEALEAVYADRLDEVSGLIAAHYEQAGVVERAITCYQRAAERARRVFANAEAILSYKRVVALLKVASSLQPPQRQWQEMITQV